MRGTDLAAAALVAVCAEKIESRYAEGRVGSPAPSGPSERDELIAWLDDGLRDGRRGRLRAEYPTALTEGSPTTHFVASPDGRFASHAMAHVTEVVAAGVRVPLGMIGLVYTDPASRGAGLASACVSACLQHLAQRGVPLAALWSDLHDLYRRVGLELAGREVLLRITAAQCHAARRQLPGCFEVSPPGPEDWPALEGLYASQPSRAVREPGALELLARCPDSRMLLARTRGRVCAYAALGRGDDFGNVVHEWAGEPAGLLACLQAWLAERGELAWLTHTGEEPPAPQLRLAGAAAQPGGFALLRLLDAEGLWARLVSGHPQLEATRLVAEGDGYRWHVAGVSTRLDHHEALELVLGPELPARAWSLLCPSLRDALRDVIPWPLFVWGFDSV